MNREIKFRSWSGKRFYFWGFINEEFISPIYKDDVIVKKVQQYTGLKDKNGKEIYEGDLVSYMDYEQPLIVHFCEDGCCQFRAKLKGYGNTEQLSSEMEIIGNIYENPELLELNKQSL